jgi:hypothetical protein
MKKLLSTFLLLLGASFAYGQVVINEASNSNGTHYVLPNGSSPDWIELYNAGVSSYSLQGHFLSDNRDSLQKWAFPPNFLGSQQFLTVLANGKGSTFLNNQFETAIDHNMVWKYSIPNANIPNWTALGFDDSGWSIGKMSIGYGDGDDSTLLVGPVTSYYARCSFQISNYPEIVRAILDIDYDDGFVAYLNGTEIARAGLVGTPPNFDELSTDHEAQLYQGGQLSSIEIDMSVLANVLINGTNVLAIEVHNNDPNSSDLTCRPFLTFGFESAQNQFNGTTHPYFNVGNQGGTLETNFGIATSGETLYLSNATGIIDSLVVPDLEAEMSVGNNQDGVGPTVIFPVPTPNSSNNAVNGYTGYEATPIIQQVGGIYPQSISVTVTNTSVNGGIVRYTLNGNDPDTSSLVYTDPLFIDTHSVVKVRCFPVGTNLLPSPFEAETFLFNESSTIPIIALTIDSNDLFGPTGIFDNWWTDWKRPCFIEYFDTLGVKRFESKASVKPDGGAGGSRNNPQHSVTVEPANNTFGTGLPIHFPIIPEKPYVDDYYALFIRNGSNFWNQYHQRDATFNKLMKNTHVDYQAYTPANIFINGKYFGVYELREKTNEGYFIENYGNHKDELDLLSVSFWYGGGQRIVKGSDTSFFTMLQFLETNDPNSSTYLKSCDKLIDTKNYADYIIGENWIANTDWIWNNVKLARARTAGNRWRFLLWDLEWGLGGWTDYNGNMFHHFRLQNLPNYYWTIFENLMENAEFRNYFINRYADIMNTRMHTNQFTPMVNRLYEELLHEMPRHHSLWTGDPIGGMDTYTNCKNNILYHFENRSPVVRNQMLEEYGLDNTVNVTLKTIPENAGYLKISTIIPDSLPWTGVYFNGNPVRISAHANPGFTFDHWEYNINLSPNQLTQSSLVLNIASDDYFHAIFKGTPKDTTLTVSEIHYNPDPSLDGGNWIELLNFGDAPIDLTGYRVKSSDFYDKFEFQDGTVIPAKGHLVVAQDTVLFKSIYPEVYNVTGGTVFGWENNEDSIYILGPHNENIVAMHYNNEAPYPRCADGYGRTMENKYADAQILDSTSWFCGCIGGSPGEAYHPCKEDLIVSEFNLGKVEILHNAEDWIELKNNSENPINLNGFVLKDERDFHQFSLEGITLEPGAYAVIVRDSSLFHQRHLDFTGQALYQIPFGISKNDAIRIFDPNGVIVQSVFIDTLGTWLTAPFNEDYTFEYQEFGTNQTLADQWFTGCIGGSPGRAFSPCLEIPNEEWAWIYPNPNSGEFTLNVLSDGKTTYKVFNDRGQYLLEGSVEKTLNPIATQEIDISKFAQGLYLLSVTRNEEPRVFRIIKL